MFSKDVWTAKCMLHSFSISIFWHWIIMATSSTFKETSTLTSLFLMDIIMDYVLSCYSANTYGLEKVVRVIYVTHKDVWTTTKLPYQCVLTLQKSKCHGTRTFINLDKFPLMRRLFFMVECIFHQTLARSWCRYIIISKSMMLFSHWSTCIVVITLKT